MQGKKIIKNYNNSCTKAITAAQKQTPEMCHDKLDHHCNYILHIEGVLLNM